MVLDPTALLLMEAAAQLQELVRQQEQLRQLRREHCCPEDSDSECGSDCEAPCGPVPGSYPGMGTSCDTASVPRSLDTVGSVSVATVSASASGSCPASLASVGGASLPLSRSLRSARAGDKRCALERQYAIDLDGYCRVIGQRLPLPMPQEALD